MKLGTLFAIALAAGGISPAYAFTLGGSDPNLQGWQTKTLTFAVNYTNCTVPQATMDAAIDAAFTLWNGVTTSNLVLARGGVSTSTPAALIAGTATDSPVIACDNAFQTNTGADHNQVAGVGTYSATGSVINYGFLLINSDASAQAAFDKISAASQSVIMAHEIGHVLGLGHSPDTKALMYYDASAKTTLALSQDDADGLSYLYPRKELSGDKLMGCGTLAVIGGSGGKGSGKLPTGALELGFLVGLAAVATRLARRGGTPSLAS